jgi:hypothetical protein
MFVPLKLGIESTGVDRSPQRHGRGREVRQCGRRRGAQQRSTAFYAGQAGGPNGGEGGQAVAAGALAATARASFKDKARSPVAVKASHGSAHSRFRISDFGFRILFGLVESHI